MSKQCNCHGSGDKHSATVAALLERPRFSPGLILEDSDLTAAVTYTQTLNRLLFRNLFGCGVLCGLTVEAERDCGLQVTVAPGIALDGCGDPVQLVAPVTITIDQEKLRELEKVPKAGKPFPKFWVILCGQEKACAPRSLVCDADEFDALTQPTRIRALSQVALVFDTKPECICECQRPDSAGPGNTQPGGSESYMECHYDHEKRVDCAPDCGCGTACACGCCVLLAEVEGRPGIENTPWPWTPRHRGVRRFVRPAMLADPAPDAPRSMQGESTYVRTDVATKTIVEEVELAFNAGDLRGERPTREEVLGWITRGFERAGPVRSELGAGRLPREDAPHLKPGVVTDAPTPSPAAADASGGRDARTNAVDVSTPAAVDRTATRTASAEPARDAAAVTAEEIAGAREKASAEAAGGSGAELPAAPSETVVVSELRALIKNLKPDSQLSKRQVSALLNRAVASAVTPAEATAETRPEAGTTEAGGTTSDTGSAERPAGSGEPA